MAKVIVYQFKKYDINSDKEIASKAYATRQAIEQFGGRLIEESAIEIDESMLDGNGKYGLNNS